MRHFRYCDTVSDGGDVRGGSFDSLVAGSAALGSLRLDFSYFVIFVTLSKSFLQSRKLSGGPWLSKTGSCSRQDAKNAKSGKLNFLRLLRLCGRYPEFWFRLLFGISHRVAYFDIRISDLRLKTTLPPYWTKVQYTSTMAPCMVLSKSVFTRRKLYV
jgi:hypothetical protein